MTEQELKQQIFDLEDKIYNKYKELKFDNINELFKLKNSLNSQEIKNAMIRQCIKKSLNAFFNHTKNDDIKFIFHVSNNNKKLDKTESFYISKNKYLKPCEIKHKIFFKSREEVKNFMDLSTNDVCQKYLIEHEKYTEKLVIELIDNIDYICVCILVK